MFYVKVPRSELRKDDLLDYLDKAKDADGNTLISKIGDGIYKIIPDLSSLDKDELIQLIYDTKDDVEVIVKTEYINDYFRNLPTIPNIPSPVSRPPTVWCSTNKDNGMESNILLMN